MELLIASNPDPDSRLPFLLWLPLGDGLVFRTKDAWPRTSALYCHPVPVAEWPDILERVPVRACARRGAAIDAMHRRSRPAAPTGRGVHRRGGVGKDPSLRAQSWLLNAVPKAQASRRRTRHRGATMQSATQLCPKASSRSPRTSAWAEQNPEGPRGAVSFR